MSGGFFRGTSADQDTRFSNKQAKLMKSQKFAPELENLVDMTKVKMDVLRPWIAKRVTELLGFEDEVLINFIYGLLDAKIVNGKEIQISLTGFMEKNTGKFMKELWTHLLSAQNNASGVPQQFLDEKEEETKRKKADADRIINEIQRKKEREAEESEVHEKKMEGGRDTSRFAAADENMYMNRRNGREPIVDPTDRKDIFNNNGRSRNNRRSRSSSSPDSSRSPKRSRSVSKSPQTRQRSISPERALRGRKRSITPHLGRSSRRSPSPSRRRPSHAQRRSRSRSYSRSVSPLRFPSFRLRSLYLRRRRSPSPVRRRSPHRRSRSPVRRRSPPRRSRSPLRRRSPPRRSRSPGRRRSPPHSSRSPVRCRSRSLGRRRSPSPSQHRSVRQSLSPASPTLLDRSPVPLQGASPTQRHSSPSPCGHRSPPSPASHRLSPPRRCRSPSPILRIRGNHRSPSTPTSSPEVKRLSSDRGNQLSTDSGSSSPERSVYASPIRQGSPSSSKGKSPNDLKESVLPPSGVRNSSQNSRKGRNIKVGRNCKEGASYTPKALQIQNDRNREESLQAISVEKSPSSSKSPENINGVPQDELRSTRRKESKTRDGIPPLMSKDQSSRRRKSCKDAVNLEMLPVGDQKHKMEDGGLHHHNQDSKADTKKGENGGSCDSGAENSKKREHKSASSDSEAEEKKDAKRRRRKEEKRLRRETRREEKRHKKEERRAEKQLKSSSRRSKDEGESGCEKVFEDLEGEERRLEIELRKKALESLKAKKGGGTHR